MEVVVVIDAPACTTVTGGDSNNSSNNFRCNEVSKIEITIKIEWYILKVTPGERQDGHLQALVKAQNCLTLVHTWLIFATMDK